MGNRRLSRETAMQVLYLLDVTSLSVEEACAAVCGTTALSPKVIEFAKVIIDGTMAQKEYIDDLISRYAENWELSRMATVDRNVLRLSTYEILNHPETPISVVIDEALEIVKSYSTDDSSKFVNGILDKMKTERKAAP